MPANAGRLLRYRRRAEEDRKEATRREYEQEVVRQIDTLQQTVENERDKVLKKKWVEEIERFYNLTDLLAPVPSFRPIVQVPECQIDMLHEASDLSDLNPIPYIIKREKKDRDFDREKAFIANWKQSNYNLEFLKATIWMLFAGNGYIEVMFDPDADGGEGAVVATARHPATVYRDPYTMHDRDIRYVVFEDMMYIDDVRQKWPDQGWRVKHHRPGQPSVINRSISLPEGPMSLIGGPIGETNSKPFASGESRVAVRKVYVNDYSTKPTATPTGFAGIPNPDRQLRFPNGRLIVECEGVVLFDGENPIPNKTKPLVTLWGMPPLTSAFAPPAIRYTRGLQDLAERMYTQLYENAVRVNNAVIFIDEASGIDLEEFGGVPGEAHMITQGSKPPEFTWPQPMPQQMMELPKTLLEQAEKLRGMTPSRRGMTQAGNVSAPLFDSALMQSQSLTRLRSRFLADSFQRFSQVVFVMMARFYTTSRTFPVFQDEKYDPVDWEKIDEGDLSDYIIRIDENSIRPYSQTALRAMVPIMKQLGIIDPETAMDLLDVPNKEQVLQRLKEQAQQAAQAKQAQDAAKHAARGSKAK